jgi:hypothetical protein
MANTPLKSLYTNLDIMRLIKLATIGLPAPNADNEGAIAYDSTTQTLKVSNGSAWTAAASSGYSTIQDEGSNLTVRATLNFIGAGITVTDNGGSSRTDVTLHEADYNQAGVVSTSAQTFRGAKRAEITALTSSGASIAVDLSLNNNYSHTFTENTTLAAPTNPEPGQSGIITFKQHASSPKTLAFNSFWRFPGGTPVAPVTAANNAIDALVYFVDPTGTYAICNILNDVKV